MRDIAGYVTLKQASMLQTHAKARSLSCMVSNVCLGCGLVMCAFPREDGAVMR